MTKWYQSIQNCYSIWKRNSFICSLIHSFKAEGTACERSGRMKSLLRLSGKWLAQCHSQYHCRLCGVPNKWLASPFMGSDCCLSVELCCDYWGFSFSYNHLSGGQENCHFGPLPLLPLALLILASSAQSNEAVLVWDSNSEGQELYNIQELLG